MFDLTGKVVIVCGGAGHLGLPACIALAKHNAKVVIADINETRLTSAVAELKKVITNTGAAVVEFVDVVGLQFDITNEDSIHQLISNTIERFGRLDIAVIATFEQAGPSFDDITAKEFNRALYGNITGTFLMARSAAQAMSEGGSIITYTSIYGCVAPVFDLYEDSINPNPIEYGIAKAGIIQMTRYLAAYYGPQNIRVNTIMPGALLRNTTEYPDFVEQFPEFVKRLSNRTMLGRIGKKYETAGAVVFLASDASSYVTGHVLRIDGGWTAL